MALSSPVLSFLDFVVLSGSYRDTYTYAHYMLSFKDFDKNGLRQQFFTVKKDHPVCLRPCPAHCCSYCLAASLSSPFFSVGLFFLALSCYSSFPFSGVLFFGTSCVSE